MHAPLACVFLARRFARRTHIKVLQLYDGRRILFLRNLHFFVVVYIFAWRQRRMPDGLVLNLCKIYTCIYIICSIYDDDDNDGEDRQSAIPRSFNYRYF